jgi:hypothetical protein
MRFPEETASTPLQVLPSGSRLTGRRLTINESVDFCEPLCHNGTVLEQHRVLSILQGLDPQKLDQEVL